ncbi:hypothetical protein LC612_37395 [Nostoc sp. CHAB 5834]|nr:hypothetical protein [Nostoc sp. CHAB 5834]
MHKFKDKSFTVAQEIEAVTQYIAEKWSVGPCVGSMVSDVATRALFDGRWYLDGYEAWFKLHQRLEARRDLLKGAYPTNAAIAQAYDGSCLQMTFLGGSLSILESHCRRSGSSPDFTTRAETVFQRAFSMHPGLEGAYPAGWTHDIPEDIDGLSADEYEKGQLALDEAAFGGGTAGGESLPYAVSLPSVVHEGYRRKYKPGQVLVTAVYAHFLKFVSHLNSQAIEKALHSLHLQDTSPHLVWNVNLDSTNPHLWVALKLSEHQFHRQGQIVLYGEAGYANALAALREYEQLSDDDKAKAQAQSAADLDQMMSENETDESRQHAESIAAQDSAVLTSLLAQAERLITPRFCI